MSGISISIPRPTTSTSTSVTCAKRSASTLQRSISRRSGSRVLFSSAARKSIHRHRVVLGDLLIHLILFRSGICNQVVDRIDRFVVNMYFVVQVGTLGHACVSAVSDQISTFDF